MKRGAFLLAVFVAIYTAACSGGGSAPSPPPPVGGFSDASLNGQYAFLMSGKDAGGFFGRAGVFVADGNGHITGGIEDVNTVLAGGTTQTLTFKKSTYSIQADGRGTIQLINQTGTLTFSATLLSIKQGYIVETDGIATTSGTFNLQNTSAFTQASISGPYVFDVSGVAPDPSNATVSDSIVGQLVMNGGGVTGVYDENLGAEFAVSPVPVTSGTYPLDATYGATFGRGTLNFGGFSYIYYMVDANRIRLIENSSVALTLGDAVAQTNAPMTNADFTGSFAFLLGGSSSSGPDTRVGRVTSTANGTLSNIAMDENNAGQTFRVPQGSLSATTYSIDPNFPGSGRGTMTFKDSSLGTYQFVFYMSSPSQGVIQDDSSGFVSDGTILSQTGGPFTNASLAGNFGFNLSGISSNGSTGLTDEEDYVGQIKLSSNSSNNAIGAADFSEFSALKVFLDVVVNGNGLAIQGDGTTATGTSNTLQLRFNTSPASTLNFAAYIVNPNTIFVSGTDNNRVIAGAFSTQTQ
jgi:hypothetical protein